MTADPYSIQTSAANEVLIERIFDAPRGLVFKAWTSPEHLMRWFAPHNCTVHFYSFDFRPGGAFHTCIRNPEFGECICKHIFHDIEPPERIVYKSFFSDEKGDFVEPGDAGMDPDIPRESLVTVTFTELGNKTKLTLHQTVLESVAKRTGAYQGWTEVLDRLETLMASVSTTKEFSNVDH